MIGKQIEILFEEFITNAFDIEKGDMAIGFNKVLKLIGEKDRIDEFRNELIQVVNLVNENLWERFIANKMVELLDIYKMNTGKD